MKELIDLRSQLIKQNIKKVDVLSPLSSVDFLANGDKNYLMIQRGDVLPSQYHHYTLKDLKERIIELSPHAFQQMCSKVGVPMSYMSKCSPDVREYNVNHWLKKSDDCNLFRCIMDEDGSRIRGILSQRYTPIDDSLVVSSLIKAIDHSNLSNPAVTKMYSGEDMLRLQISDNRKPVVGDTTLGFFVGNSEVGLSRIYIEMGLYTYKCTNGLRIPNFSMEFTRKHVGNISHNMIAGSFNEQISGIMNNYSYIMGYMDIASKITLKKNQFKKYVEDNKNFSLEFKDGMKSRIKELPAKNVLWKYVGQLTEEAHHYREIERMSIEKQAGVYLDEVVRKEVKRGNYELVAA